MAEPTWYEKVKKTVIIINGEEWVPKSLLTFDNSVSDSASPKLPSLDDVYDEVSAPEWSGAIRETYYAIQRLGNFA